MNAFKGAIHGFAVSIAVCIGIPLWLYIILSHGTTGIVIAVLVVVGSMIGLIYFDPGMKRDRWLDAARRAEAEGAAKRKGADSDAHKSCEAAPAGLRPIVLHNARGDVVMRYSSDVSRTPDANIPLQADRGKFDLSGVNFAAACYAVNSIRELETALRSGNSKVDMVVWGITEEEWQESIETALRALRGDAGR